MLRFDNDHNAERLEFIVKRVRDLLGKTLLHLQPAREYLSDASKLRQADDPAAFGDVRDVALADERG
jgi:hypothetical protein